LWKNKLRFCIIFYASRCIKFNLTQRVDAQVRVVMNSFANHMRCWHVMLLPL
jgi:hypothetical protein